MRSALIFIILSIFIANTGHSQHEIDSMLVLNDTVEGIPKIKNLINIARQYMIEGDTAGVKYATEAIALARHSDYLQGTGMAMLFLGLIYEDTNPQKALHFLELSSDTLMDMKHPWAGFGYENAARLYQTKGWYPEALEMSINALKAYENAKDTFQLTKTMSSTGYINGLLGNHRENISWQKKALTLMREPPDKELLGLIFGRIGIAYDELGIYDSANFYNRKAINEFNDLNDDFYQAQWLSNIANTNIKQGRYKEAEAYLNEARRLSSSSNELTIILINLGKIYLETNRYTAADAILDSAIHMANRLDQTGFLSEAFYRKYELLQKQGQYKKALDFYIRYSSLQDSLLNEKKAEQVADMKVRYETELKEKELLAQKAENERLAKEKALAEIRVYNRNKWLIGISGLSLVIILGGLAINQRKRRKIQAEKDAAVIEEREKGIKAVFDAQEEERQRIAKDLHDGVGQQISAVKMHLQNVMQKAKDQNPEIEADLGKINQLVNDTGSDVRSISHQMMPRALTELGLVAALEDMIDKSFTYSHIQCTFEYHGLEERLPSHVEIGLYRIAQELINNIIKHSEASKVDIQLMKTSNHCILIVQDDGKGLRNVKKIEGIGMLNINSRLRTMNGELNMESATGQGTTATIRIALKHDHE